MPSKYSILKGKKLRTLSPHITSILLHAPLFLEIRYKFSKVHGGMAIGQEERNHVIETVEK
jgi:hypothetical protein